MIAIHLSQGKVELRKVPKPRRPEGFATIRLLYGGICNTDLELQRGYYGFEGIPGHEFVGEVVEADSANLVGRTVVGEINLACRRCEWCAKQLERHCPNRTVLGIVKHPGAFGELLTLPEHNLHIVPKGIEVRHAVFVEPLAAACEILDQVKISRGERVAVLGDGKLGLLVAQALQVAGAQVHQFGRHKEKLAIAEKAGVTGERLPRKASAGQPSKRNQPLPVAEYGVVVDATGSAEGLAMAVRMVWPRGTVVMKSTIHGSVAIDTAPVIVNEVTLVGSRCGRFEPALKLLAKGRVHVDEMISEEFSLSEGPKAFTRAAERGVLKVLLRA
jgi:threonine dehydrogenase-like Zn-dependent dehydrogenase